MRKIIIAAALATATAAAPATAQIVSIPSGLVTVNIQDVSLLNNFLNGAQIAALNNISALNGNNVQVQVPVGVAANVCGVSAAVLGQAGGTNPTCTAQSGSRALAQAVNRQLLNQTTTL